MRSLPQYRAQCPTLAKQSDGLRVCCHLSCRHNIVAERVGKRLHHGDADEVAADEAMRVGLYSCALDYAEDLDRAREPRGQIGLEGLGAGLPKTVQGTRMSEEEVAANACIGEQLGVTGERVRQVLKVALVKFKERWKECGYDDE